MRSLLGKFRSFNELVKARKASSRSTHTLDLFGSGLLYDNENEHFDSITGVRLKMPPYYDRELWMGLKRKAGLITGNLFEEETWQKLYRYLSKQEIESMDLITIHPAGAVLFSAGFLLMHKQTSYQEPTLAQIQSFYRHFMAIVYRAYQLLSSDEGELYVQLPQYGQDGIENSHQEWIDLLKKSGIGHEYTTDGSVYVKIVKTSDSPANLPLKL